MPTSYTIIANFPKVGDFRFTQESQFDTPYSEVSGFYQFDQRPTNDSTQWWQTDKKYYTKKTLNDLCCVMVHTNAVGSSPLVPDLFIEGTGVSYPLSFTGSPYIFGEQRIAGYEYVDPVTNTAYQLDSFMWQFYFNQFITDADTGIYRLRMRVYGDSGMTVYQDYVSDDIMVYTEFKGCTQVKATYNTNRAAEWVVVSGWVSQPVFTHRVEGQPMEYKPKANYVSYLQQNYLNQQLNVNSWRTFKFRLGDIGQGVPLPRIESVSKAFEADNFWIDGKPFILDIDNSTGLQSLWEMDDPEASIMAWASAPIREKYANENVFVTVTPTPDLLILDPDSYPYALIPWSLNDGFSIISFDAAVVDDPTAQTALVAAWNATVGLSGTFYQSGGSIYFTPSVGDASIFGDFEALYSYFTTYYSGSATGGSNGFRYAGTSAKMVVDWNDGTDVEYCGGSAGTLTVTHAFASTVSPSYDARFFHNNFVSKVEWNEAGLAYPVVDVFVYDHSGDMPFFLNRFIVDTCSQYGVLTYSLDFAACATWIASITIRGCSNYTLGTTFLNVAMANIQDLILSNCKLSTATVDDVFNDFVATVWDGVSTGGTIATNGQTPLAPPTAASAASRLALTTASWTLSTD